MSPGSPCTACLRQFQSMNMFCRGGWVFHPSHLSNIHDTVAKATKACTHSHTVVTKSVSCSHRLGSYVTTKTEHTTPVRLLPKQYLIFSRDTRYKDHFESLYDIIYKYVSDRYSYTCINSIINHHQSIFMNMSPNVGVVPIHTIHSTVP